MKVACMLAGAALTLALTPVVAVAQSSDATYCSALSNKYNTYVLTRGSRGAKQTPPADIANAMSKCQSSDVTSAIPVLEKALEDAKIDLPSRG